MAISECYDNFLRKCKLLIIFFWVGIFCVSAVYGRKFMSATKSTFSAPVGTLAHEAKQVYSREFPNEPYQVLIFVEYGDLFPTPIGGIGNDSEVRAMAYSLNTTLTSQAAPGVLVGFRTAYFYEGTVYGEFGAQFIAPNKRALSMQVQYHNLNANSEKSFLQMVRDAIAPYDQNKLPGRQIGLTGTDVLLSDVQKSAEKDLIKSDAIVIPLALLVLAFVVRSVRLVLIPIISVLLSLIASFAFMYPLAVHVFEVASFTPSIMTSLVIAMSIDYSLFMLTRYKEEIQSGQSIHEAVRQMGKHSGKIVFVSGSTLAITFLGLVFFPFDLLRATGIGAAGALICTMAVNLTLTPSLLLTFGNFFSNFGWSCRSKGDESRRHTQTDEPLIHTALSSTSSDSRFQKVRSREEEKEAQARHCCFRTAECATSRRFAPLIILLLLGASIPLSAQLMKMKITIDTELLFPRNSPAFATYNRMQEYFTPGRLSPYVLVLPSDKGPKGVWNIEMFNQTQSIVTSLIAHGLVKPEAAFAMSWDNGKAITWEEAQQAIQRDIAYVLLLQALTNSDASSTKIQLLTSFDPFGDEATDWVRSVRDVVSGYQKAPYDVYLSGAATDAVDCVDIIYKAFPTSILLTASMVFVIVGVHFKSVVVPVRLLLTIACPLSFVYGIAVLIFNPEYLHWRHSTGIYWLTPVMSFSILVGLGLDYDIFLFSRVYEYRRLGYQNHAAITKGVYKTGGIITAAGVIMALAFAGLMMSEQTVLNQFGFILSTAVLIDTFLIRTLMVPACVRVLGNFNWWPGYVPPAHKTAFDQDDFSDFLFEDDPLSVSRGKSGHGGTSALTASKRERDKERKITFDDNTDHDNRSYASRVSTIND